MNWQIWYNHFNNQVPTFPEAEHLKGDRKYKMPPFAAAPRIGTVKTDAARAMLCGTYMLIPAAATELHCADTVKLDMTRAYQQLRAGACSIEIVIDVAITVAPDPTELLALSIAGKTDNRPAPLSQAQQLELEEDGVNQSDTVGGDLGGDDVATYEGLQLLQRAQGSNFVWHFSNTKLHARIQHGTAETAQLLSKAWQHAIHDMQKKGECFSTAICEPGVLGSKDLEQRMLLRYLSSDRERAEERVLHGMKIVQLQDKVTEMLKLVREQANTLRGPGNSRVFNGWWDSVTKMLFPCKHAGLDISFEPRSYLCFLQNWGRTVHMTMVPVPIRQTFASSSTLFAVSNILQWLRTCFSTIRQCTLTRLGQLTIDEHPDPAISHWAVSGRMTLTPQAGGNPVMMKGPRVIPALLWDREPREPPPGTKQSIGDVRYLDPWRIHTLFLTRLMALAKRPIRRVDKRDLLETLARAVINLESTIYAVPHTENSGTYREIHGRSRYQRCIKCGDRFYARDEEDRMGSKKFVDRECYHCSGASHELQIHRCSKRCGSSARKGATNLFCTTYNTSYCCTECPLSDRHTRDCDNMQKATNYWGSILPIHGAHCNGWQ